MTAVSSEWARLLERLLYLFPPVIGVGIVGVLQDAEPGVPGLQQGLILFGTFGYTVLTLGVTATVVLDARRVRRQPRASGNWRPRVWLYGGAAVLSPAIAGVIYLIQRHRQFGTPSGWSGWWIVVAISLASTLFGIVAATVALVFAMPGLFTTAVGLAGAIAFGSFPVAIHQDAAYVSTERTNWRPNPGFYLGVAFLSLSIPPLQPLVAGYYLYNRHRAIGTL
ncbi:hypothetical protein B2G88_13415 [Natronolimnobius baerhuensis]|uniref:Uncharacterized protein n=1 Tax=Natronolimnobius baerhuensis TaxID=253108 RepID=A0A202E7S7_9EURY|nr:hypothetical protein B2G88_13415 [Natronolimnobius baerhuensis]